MAKLTSLDYSYQSFVSNFSQATEVRLTFKSHRLLYESYFEEDVVEIKVEKWKEAA